MSARYSPAAVAEALAIIHEPGAVFEIRAPKANGRKNTVSGYFDDPHVAAAEIAKWDGRAAGVYTTINPPDPALLARAANHLEPYAENTTSDTDITCRRWLPIDIDAVRPAGISATKTERAAALGVAASIVNDLRAQGWPDPLSIFSGNGAWLLYRVALLNDEINGALTKRCLEALAAKHNNGAVKIDTTVGNAARIGKIPGTLTCKGDDTAERPHRRARILKKPDVLEPVPRALLEALAATVPTPEPAKARGNGGGDGGFTALEFIERNHLTVIKTSQKANGGVLYELEECPFNPGHHQGEAYVGEMPSGALYAGCHHNSCTWDWRALRERLEPRARRGGRQTTASAAACDGEEQGPRGRDYLRCLADTPDKDTEWCWVQRIPRCSPTILFGETGMLKSHVYSRIATHVTTGETFIDGSPCPCGNVVILSAEDDDTVLKQRLAYAGADLSRVFIFPAVASFDKRGRRTFNIHDDEAMLRDAAISRQAVLIVVDPITAYLSGVKTHEVAEIRAVLAVLTDVTKDVNAACIAVMHPNKNADANIAAVKRLSGSGAFGDAPRAIILVGLDENDESQQRHVFVQVKMSLAASPLSLGYRLTAEGPLSLHSRIDFDAAPVLVNPNSVLAGGHEESEQMQAARELLLRVVVEPRWYPAGDLKDEAAMQQPPINEKTLRRAKDKLNLQGWKPDTIRIGAPTYWALPGVPRERKLLP